MSERSLCCTLLGLTIPWVLALATPALGQPIQEWVAYYTGPNDGRDYTTGVVLDPVSGNVYQTGVSSGFLRSEYATVAYDTNGTLLWAQRYHGADKGVSAAFGIALDAYGNVYVTGNTKQVGRDRDMTTISYSPSGTQRWIAHYNGAANDGDVARDIAVDPAGNVYITGYSVELGPRGDMTTVSYDSSGNQRWVATYNGPANDFDGGYAIAITSNGDICTAGYSFEGPDSDYFVTICYDSSGNRRWVARYDAKVLLDGEPNSIAADANGNVYVNGKARGSGSSLDYATISYDSNGNQRWVAIYDGPASFNDRPRAIAVDAAGNSYVTGVSSNTWADNEIVTVSYDPGGRQRWVHRYPRTGSDCFDSGWDIAISATGDVHVVGDTYLRPCSPDIILIGLCAETGAQRFERIHNGPWALAHDQGRNIATDASGCSYVSGSGPSSGRTGRDFVLIKYCEEPSGAQVTAHAGGPYTIECNGAPTSAPLNGSRSSEPNCLPLTYNWTTDCPGGRFEEPSDKRPDFYLSGPPPCPVECSVTLTVTNELGEGDSDTTEVVNQDTTPPVLVGVPPDETVECDAVPLPPPVTATDACDPDPRVILAETRIDGPCPGTYTLERTWTATDRCGNSASQTRTIEVVDTTPPVIPPGEENLYCLWPPNHRMVCFTQEMFDPEIADNCSEPISWRIEDCASDEPDDGPTPDGAKGGDGHTTGDCSISPDGTGFCARAERSGVDEDGQGRRYAVVISATDACGNSSAPVSIGYIHVPHDQREHPDCLRRQ